MSKSHKFKDLTNQKYGFLTALFVDERKTTPHHTYWVCRCVCGETRSLQTYQLTSGRVTSCGCQNPRTKLHAIVQGRKRMYSIYSSMISRCHSPKSVSYRYYGGKGISVCDEWRESFESFAVWAESNGYNDSLSIDRIDNSKGYSPSNCRWIPLSEQSDNKSTTVRISHNGETHNLKTWCETLDFPYSLAKSRHKEAKRNNVVPTFDYLFAPNKRPRKTI